jgi:predicted GNAT family N-acyltransferase
MPGIHDIRIVLGDWRTLRPDASGLRHEVFVIEQNVPPEIEMDEFDEVSLHAVAYLADGGAIATARLLPDNHIGRMAVRKSARGQGIGGRVLAALVERAAQEGRPSVVLNAQTHARAFYEAHGFSAAGPEFMEAGIAHITMTRELDAAA